MSIVLWCIPLYVLAIAIAIAPLLHGSLSLKRWEQEHVASTFASALSLLEEGPMSNSTDAETSWARLDHARSEALSLLGRLEELKVELTSLEHVAEGRERTKGLHQGTASLPPTASVGT